MSEPATTGPSTVGIIGTGSLAGFFVEGIMRAKAPYRFVVSPRNVARAADLAHRFGAAVPTDNQQVIDRADLVVVSVLPKDGEAVLQPLRFRPGQPVLSVMAAFPHARVAELVAPARASVALMPGHSNVLGMGPSVLYPGDPAVCAFLAHLGPVHVLPDWAAFTAAAAAGGFSGASFAFIGTAIDWFIAQGLEPRMARELVTGTLIGNAEVIARSHEPLEAIVAGVATPGGLSEQVIRHLRGRGALEAWGEALDAVRRRIAG